MADGSKHAFLSGRHAQVITLLLVVQAALFHLMPATEKVPLSRPLSSFPTLLNNWRMTEEAAIDPEIQESLKADDTLNRLYLDATAQQSVSLFVAFFQTQRAGASPHSPKVCLPGSGWVPTESRVVSISVPGRPEPISANRYVVAREGQENLVIYWYQSHNRVVANEYAAKLYLMLDSIRYHRSDTSLVRVMVPILAGREDAAEQTAVRFVQEIFNPLRNLLPR